jgi:zinc protease
MKLKSQNIPLIHPAPAAILPEPEVVKLDNGIDVYILHSNVLDVLKMEVLVEAGRPHETTKLTARTTSKMIREGNKSLSAEAFAELFDFHGATFSCPSHMDVAAFQLYTLRRHAKELVPAVAEALRFPNFGLHELDLFKQAATAELALELSKPEALAYRHLTEFLYGAEHPYGYNSTSELYAQITPEHLRAFHTECYTPERTALIISGNVTSEVMSIVQSAFESWPLTGKDSNLFGQVSAPKAPITDPLKLKMPLKASDQTAIKIGRRLFGRHHPDYLPMGLLNMVLGGYFGSRLMTNVREKKGYTYNIYSSFDVLRDDGFLYIASEVNKRKTTKAISAIHDEMKKLQDDPISDTELQMVKNYLSGMTLMAVDGSLNQSNLLKSLVIDQIGVLDFQREVNQIAEITPAALQALAQRWLSPDEMWEVVV